MAVIWAELFIGILSLSIVSTAIIAMIFKILWYPTPVPQKDIPKVSC